MDIHRTASASSVTHLSGPAQQRVRKLSRQQGRPNSAASELGGVFVDEQEDQNVPARRNSVQGMLAPPNLRTDTERSFIALDLGAVKPRPLALNVAKQRRRPENDLETKRRDAAVTPVAPPRSARRREGPSGDGDNLDRHVSDVLDRLPSRIRFTPGAQSATTSSASKHKQSTPTTSKSTRPGPGLTLAPARNPGASRSAADAKSKVYHLSQPGRDQPIKLFVRLVGEDERVMVRVGGGWSDLGEYLRQYAEHHGSRTVSSSHIEVQEASAGSQAGAMKTRSPQGRPESATDFYSRLESALSHRRTSNGVQQTPELGSSSPVSSPTWGSPNYTYSKPSEATPKSVSSKSNSRPSTAGDGWSSRPMSRQDWMAGDMGLAGPAGSKRGGELTEAKAKWVEDMMHKAKTASTEKKRTGDERTALTDMGRMGSTRRVIFNAQDW